MSGSVVDPWLIGLQGSYSLPDSAFSFEPPDGYAGTLNDVHIRDSRFKEIGLVIGSPGVEGGLTRVNTSLATTSIISDMITFVKDIFTITPDSE